MEDKLEIRQCNCGGKIKMYFSSRCDHGSAIIQCSNCTININESTHSLGYNDTLDSLKHRALSKWNFTFGKNELTTIKWNGFNCYE